MFKSSIKFIVALASSLINLNSVKYPKKFYFS